MNPIDELKKLSALFPGGDALFAKVEHIPGSQAPEPYKGLLVHDHHMTVAMEEYHQCTVDVTVLQQRMDGDTYSREIVLTKQGTDRVVQYGLVQFHFQYVTQDVRDEILGGKIPLGRVLIRHNVLRHIDLGAIVRITAGPGLAKALQMEPGGVTYGRLATIFCNGQPAVDLFEVSIPLASDSARGPI